MSKFYHCVHFWMKPEHQEGAAFEKVLQGIRSLGQSANMESCRVAVPAGTPRDVVDNSYSAQLLAVFPDAEAHARYQSDDDAVHQAFVANFKHCWTKVLIYDSIEPASA
ncbi:MAG: Dabb family protein [Phycisphaeraceae bacterium]